MTLTRATRQIALTVSGGSFERGFSVSIETPYRSSLGKLPPRPQLPDLYAELQESLGQLRACQTDSSGLRSDPDAVYPDDDDLEFDSTLPTSRWTGDRRRACLQLCLDLKQQIEREMKDWLNTTDPSWATVRESAIEAIHYCTDIVLKTDLPLLYKLPWHLWNLFETRRDLELTFAPGSYQNARPIPRPPHLSRPRLLAAIGSEVGIDCLHDRAVLQPLKNGGAAEVQLLEQPEVTPFLEQLRRSQGWDVLTFSGHSKTQQQQGSIYLNAERWLSVEQFQHAIRDAASKGLTLAIFNSCQGLGIAQNFVDLQVPVVVVMREPVDDRIASRFLDAFWRSYSEGAPLAAAVRQARERLEDEELQYPSATWLPTIFRNPQVSLPNWRSFYGTAETAASEVAPSRESEVTTETPETLPASTASASKRRHWRSRLAWCGVPLLVTGLVWGVRQMTWLEPLELFAYDVLLRSRLTERATGTHPDVLVVEVTSADLDYQRERDMAGSGSLSDTALQQVLAQLTLKGARTIGLDIYRDRPTLPQYPALAEDLRSLDNFIVVCKSGNTQPPFGRPDDRGQPPPPEVTSDYRIGFTDLYVDKDDVIRRSLLSLKPEPNSTCRATSSFALQVASHYLQQQNLEWQQDGRDRFSIAAAEFSPANRILSTYRDIEYYGKDNKNGYQLMLNYRSRGGSLRDSFDVVTLRDLLEGRVPQEAVRDRIVLIGTTAPIFRDYHNTPFDGVGLGTAGVVLQAQMTVQLVDAALGRRQFLWSLPRWMELLLGVMVAVGGTLWGRHERGSWALCFVPVMAIAGLAWVAFQASLWVPVVPLQLCLAGSYLGARRLGSGRERALAGRPMTQDLTSTRS